MVSLYKGGGIHVYKRGVIYAVRFGRGRRRAYGFVLLDEDVGKEPVFIHGGDHRESICMDQFGRLRIGGQRKRVLLETEIRVVGQLQTFLSHGQIRKVLNPWVLECEYEAFLASIA